MIWNYSTNLGSADVLYYYIGDALLAKEIKLVEYSNQLIDANKLIGKEPKEDDEIVISSFIADQIIHKGILAKKEKSLKNAENYKPTSYDEIINNNYYISFGGMFYVRVTGILDYKNEMLKYSKLKEVKASKYFDMNPGSADYNELDNLYWGLLDECDYLLRVFVNKTFIDKVNLKEENKSNSTTKVMIDNNIIDVDIFGYILNDLENNQNEHAIEYIHTLSDSFDQTVRKQYCLNNTINMIIASYENRIQEENIDFRYQLSVPKKLDISDIDLTSILSNALENALKAVLLLKDYRFIHLTIEERCGKLLISVENNYLNEPVFVDGLPISKEKNHGFGSQSIVYTVEKLNGNCQFSINNHHFLLRIVI